MSVLLFYIIFMIAIGVFLKARNHATFRNHAIITDAIYAYRSYQIKHGNYSHFEVGYEDKEDYNETFMRMWDWGYTRILPPEKFKIIEPFI